MRIEDNENNEVVVPVAYNPEAQSASATASTPAEVPAATSISTSDWIGYFFMGVVAIGWWNGYSPKKSKPAPAPAAVQQQQQVDGDFFSNLIWSAAVAESQSRQQQQPQQPSRTWQPAPSRYQSPTAQPKPQAPAATYDPNSGLSFWRQNPSLYRERNEAARQQEELRQHNLRNPNPQYHWGTY